MKIMWRNCSGVRKGKKSAPEFVKDRRSSSGHAERDLGRSQGTSARRLQLTLVVAKRQRISCYRRKT